MERLRGAYSTVVMTGDAVVAFRDPAGVRPLCLGRLEDRYVVASESCALDIIGAELMREVQPGELISLGTGGIETRQAVESERPAACVFEHIYFSRPDSKLEGRTLQSARGRMGEILAREAPVDADLVISVPDSGNAAAKGFARASGIPQDDGLIKNRYVARTFIQPGQELRRHGLRMKFNPLPDVVRGKRLVIVDDSIVRGNTMRQIVQMLREAGAKEVHLRMSSPPIRHPCHYGIDMPTSEEMIAHGRTVEEVAEEVGADSLAYLSLEGVYEAIGSGRDTHCDACFTGDYPLEGTERANGKHALEELAVVRRATRAVPHRGTGRRARARIFRRSSTRSTARGHRGRRGREQQARRQGARAGRRRRDRHARVRGGRLPEPRRARPRDGGVARRSAGSSWSCSPGSWSCWTRLSWRLRGTGDQRPSGAAASLSRSPPGRRPDRVRREGGGSHGPLRGRRG